MGLMSRLKKAVTPSKKLKKALTVPKSIRKPIEKAATKVGMSSFVQQANIAKAIKDPKGYVTGVAKAAAKDFEKNAKVAMAFAQGGPKAGVQAALAELGASPRSEQGMIESAVEESTVPQQAAPEDGLREPFVGEEMGASAPSIPPVALLAGGAALAALLVLKK